jgi:hypothetical protein
MTNVTLNVPCSCKVKIRVSLSKRSRTYESSGSSENYIIQLDVSDRSVSLTAGQWRCKGNLPRWLHKRSKLNKV